MSRLRHDNRLLHHPTFVPIQSVHVEETPMSMPFEARCVPRIAKRRLPAALLLAIGAAPLSAQAAISVTVTSSGDAATSSTCTLRQAIAALRAGGDFRSPLSLAVGSKFRTGSS